MTLRTNIPHRIIESSRFISKEEVCMELDAKQKCAFNSDVNAKLEYVSKSKKSHLTAEKPATFNADAVEILEEMSDLLVD